MCAWSEYFYPTHTISLLPWTIHDIFVHIHLPMKRHTCWTSSLSKNLRQRQTKCVIVGVEWIQVFCWMNFYAWRCHVWSIALFAVLVTLWNLTDWLYRECSHYYRLITCAQVHNHHFGQICLSNVPKGNLYFGHVRPSRLCYVYFRQMHHVYLIMFNNVFSICIWGKQSLGIWGGTNDFLQQY